MNLIGSFPGSVQKEPEGIVKLGEENHQKIQLPMFFVATGANTKENEKAKQGFKNIKEKNTGKTLT